MYTIGKTQKTKIMSHSNPYSNKACEVLVSVGWQAVRHLRGGTAGAFFALDRSHVLRLLGKEEGKLDLEELKRQRPFVSCSYGVKRENIPMEVLRVKVEDFFKSLNKVASEVFKTQGNKLADGALHFLSKECSRARKMQEVGAGIWKSLLSKLNVRIPETSTKNQLLNMVCTAAQVKPDLALDAQEQAMLNKVQDKNFSISKPEEGYQLVNALIKQAGNLLKQDKWNIFERAIATNEIALHREKDGSLRPITHCAEPMAAEFLEATRSGRKLVVGIAYYMGDGDYPCLIDPCSNCSAWVLEGGSLSGKIEVPIAAMIVHKKKYKTVHHERDQIKFKVISRADQVGKAM